MIFRLLLIQLFIIASVGFADSTFFREDFNSTWSTNSPPSNWYIYFQEPIGFEDWHRDSANTWQNNNSGYAKISYANELIKQLSDTIIDSLVSPIIDGSRFRNISLRCSTFFRHNNGSYQAKIIGSIDGGKSYPYQLIDYIGHYHDSIINIDIFDLDWADEQDSIRLAFVFVGRIIDIHFWCLDNISLTGEYIYDRDIAPIEILRPTTIQPPGEVTIRVKVANLGKLLINDNFAVCCSVYNWAGVPLSYADALINNIAYCETLEVDLLPSYNFPNVPNFYKVKVWSELSGDENIYNDTLEKDFSVAWSQLLFNTSEDAYAGSCFEVREQGYGCKFTPGFYPALINQVQFYLGIPDQNKPYRYKIRIVDDNGPNGMPGKTIFESDNFIDSILGWKTIYLFNEELYIDSGSVYIFYIQVEDAPNAPLLFYDQERNPSNIYYKYYYDNYVPDYPLGDWLVQMLVEYRPRFIYDNDLRVVFIAKPIDEFVRRPVNFTTPIVFRIENIGRLAQNNFSVYCTVRSYSTGVPGAVVASFTRRNLSLEPGRDTMISFPWTLIYNEAVQITARVYSLFDQHLDNDYKQKIVNNKVAKFTSRENVILGYAWCDSDTNNGPIYNWHSTNTARLILDIGDDTIVNVFPLPFNFPFYQSNYQYLSVSTDGYILFQGDSISISNNDSIPNTNYPNNALYVFWDDLILPSDRSAKIYYQVFEATRYNYCVITWENVLRKNSDPQERLNFQAILYENGDIVFQYKDVFCNNQGADYGKSATIGIENQDGTGGLQYLYGSDSVIVNWPENKLSSGRAIKFYKFIRDAAPLAIIAPTDSIVPLPLSPKVKIINCGSELEESIKVFLTIYEQTNPSLFVYDTAVTTYDLLPNQERIITMPDWSTVYVGNYVLNCSTHMYHDQNQTNNLITKSIQVMNWILKKPIESGYDNKKVKNGAMVYAPEYRKLFVLKGGNTNEFWAYDIVNDQWESLPRMPLAPSGKKAKAGCALAFGQGNFIYAMKGGNQYDFYLYNINERRWEIRSPVKDSIYQTKKVKDGAGLVYANYNGMLYAIVGNNSPHLLVYNPQNAPQGDYWRFVEQIPRYQDLKDNNIRHGGSINIADSILYIFQGNKTKELHRFDLSNLTWLPRCTIPGYKNIVKNGATATYHHLTRSLYFFLGGNKQTLWRYDVLNNFFDSISVIPKGKSNKKIKSGAAITAAGSNDPIFVLKGGNTNELWAYAFWSGKDKIYNNKIIEVPQITTKEEINTFCYKINYCHDQNSLLKIEYKLRERSVVLLKLYNLTGQEIYKVIDKIQLAGNYSEEHKLEKLRKGIYFIKGKIGSIPISEKIVVY